MEIFGTQMNMNKKITIHCKLRGISFEVELLHINNLGLCVLSSLIANLNNLPFRQNKNLMPGVSVMDQPSNHHRSLQA